MADAAISFAVEKLGDALINKVNFLRGVEEHVRWLKDELQSMQCFLKDAAEKQGNNEFGNLVYKWICDVREVAQDAEDVIEIFTLKLDKLTRNRDLVRKWAGFPGHVSHLNRVGKEIESIRNRLDEIGRRRERYGIRSVGEVVESSSARNRAEMLQLRRRMATRFQKEKDVVGLNQDTDLLLSKVILDDKRKGLSLAAIVGMGGIGKSTLARKIYNHPDVAAEFEKRAWVVVSSEFAGEDIIKQIMHELSVPLDADEWKTLESIQGTLRRQEMLQEILRNRLQGKRYFIVLDDVWEHTHWEVLKNCFPDEPGEASRLLFTSRKEIFSKRHVYIHKMRVLNTDESWELLSKTALMGRRCPKELEDIGRKILEKCHGLPLAITVAGGLLESQEFDPIGWKGVLKQMKEYHLVTSEVGSNVSAILDLSYHNLPSQLKPCFLCLAFFKEDAVFRAKRLVHIWVALGLVKVPQAAGDKSEEEIGRSYLDELITRNLVQANGDGVKNFYVHDLIRELSIRKAKEEIGLESLISEDEGSSSSSPKPRHLVVRGTGKRLIQIDKWNDQNKHLRSLFLHMDGPNDGNDAYFSTPSCWKGFELLRILDVEGSTFKRLPSNIRSLIGLRYLRLREEGVLTLPTWLDVLKNLQVLDVADCRSLELPDATWKMDGLRHFYINGECSKFSNSMKKSSWKNLETLKCIRSDNVLQGFSSRLRKLGMEIMDGEEVEMERLLVESDISVLHLRWGVRRGYRTLPFPNSLDRLTKLKLDGAMAWCPTADKFPRNITHLTLSESGIRHNDPMQELGKLPNLLVLKLHNAIRNMGSIRVSHEGFPRLKFLHFRWMRWLQNIEIEQGGMPQLQQLQICDCPGLENNDSLRERIRPAEVVVISAD